MSAVEDDPQHLVRWCRAQGMAVGADTFVSRETYGRYLADLLDSEPVPAGSSLERVHDEVVDLADPGTTYLATLASGAVLTADVVVLALGNPPPRRPRGLAVEDAPASCRTPGTPPCSTGSAPRTGCCWSAPA